MPAIATLSAAARRARATLSHWRTLLPGDCPLCGDRARAGRLCAPCERELCWHARTGPALGLPWRCPRCALPLDGHDEPCPDCAGRDTAFDRTIAAFDYGPPGDALILEFKHGRRYPRADMLGNLLAEAVRHDRLPLAPSTVLLPVPAGMASLRARGFNPAAEIARAAARDLGLPLRRGWLWRTREQARQATQGRGGRLRAAEGLYACSPAVAGRRLALVDDVMTTGATLHAAAAALKQAGAREVVALAVARTPHAPRNVRRQGPWAAGPAVRGHGY
ncbi:ComF family protein [Pigmentiphaga soli]